MVEFTKVEGSRNIGNIKIFALSSCAWCRKTKGFLISHGIEFSYIDVDSLKDNDLDWAKSEQRKFNPRGSFPTIVVDDKQIISGYDESKLIELIGQDSQEVYVEKIYRKLEREKSIKIHSQISMRNSSK